MSITSYKTGNTSPSSLLAGNAYYVPPITFEILLVAGGASGGHPYGGGGGAGGVFYESRGITTGTTCTVTVGAGGASVNSARGNDGTNTSFTELQELELQDKVIAVEVEQ